MSEERDEAYAGVVAQRASLELLGELGRQLLDVAEVLRRACESMPGVNEPKPDVLASEKVLTGNPRAWDEAGFVVSSLLEDLEYAKAVYAADRVDRLHDTDDVVELVKQRVRDAVRPFVRES